MRSCWEWRGAARTGSDRWGTMKLVSIRCGMDRMGWDGTGSERLG